MAHHDGDSAPPDVVFEFPHDISAPAEARRALAPIVESTAFAEDVNVIASELVSNVVLHTEEGGRLDAWDSNPFRVEVHDSSPVLPVPDPNRPVGGRGLLIVDALTSDWGAEPSDDGKVVWAELERPPE